MKTIKKISVAITLVACLLTMFVLTACGKAVDAVVLDKTSATIKVEETWQLSAAIVPNDASETTVIWQSSDVILLWYQILDW